MEDWRGWEQGRGVSGVLGGSSGTSRGPPRNETTDESVRGPHLREVPTRVLSLPLLSHPLYSKSLLVSSFRSFFGLLRSLWDDTRSQEGQ